MIFPVREFGSSFSVSSVLSVLSVVKKFHALLHSTWIGRNRFLTRFLKSCPNTDSAGSFVNMAKKPKSADLKSSNS